MVFAVDGASSTPYLNEEILSLKDVEVMTKAKEPVEPSSEPATTDTGPVPVDQEPKPTEKKATKPKWFKMWLNIVTHRRRSMLPWNVTVPLCQCHSSKLIVLVCGP